MLLRECAVVDPLNTSSLAHSATVWLSCPLTPSFILVEIEMFLESHLL